MGWRCVTIQGEDITIEVTPAVDLSGGVLTGLYTCSAKALLAIYMRRGATMPTVLVTARDEARAIEKAERAIHAGLMVRRKPDEV